MQIYQLFEDQQERRYPFSSVFMLSHANNLHPPLLASTNSLTVVLANFGFCARPLVWSLNLHPKVHICLFDVRGPQEDSELQRTDDDCDQSSCRN